MGKYDLSKGDVNFYQLYVVYMMICRILVAVKGKVQGVFYRSSTLAKAKTLNIRGYVKNLNDGSVKIDAEGEKEQLIELLRWCDQGPPGASVESVQTTWLEDLKHYPNFTIQYDS